MVSDRFFVTGGNIPLGAASYVVRKADAELVDALLAGEFCYMLDSRQVGKSSLMVRAVKALRDQGRVVCVIDLQGIGNTLEQDQWYLGLLDKIGRTTGCEDEVEATFTKSSLLSPFQRWMAIFDYVILPKLEALDQSLVVFVDEIDIVRSLKFSTDEFFLGIREFHNRRSTDPRLDRITFCLLGSASPADLIQEKTVTPFNIGHRIELTDFTEEEAMVLAGGFSNTSNPEGIVKNVLAWTAGHPYLTQKLCAKCVEAGAKGGDDVVAVCEQVFFTKEALEAEPNLSFACSRILRGSEDSTTTLLALRSIRGTGIVVDESSDAHVSLLLSGIVRSVKEPGTNRRVLQIRNAIYRRVFDDDWIDSNLPEREIRREQAAQANVQQVEARAQVEIEEAKQGIKRKFTTGLLVLAGIVSAALIFGGFTLYKFVTGSFEKARYDVSYDNMKQLGMGLYLYTTDYNGRFPDMRLDYGKGEGEFSGLKEAMVPYLKKDYHFVDGWEHPFLPNATLSFYDSTQIDEPSLAICFAGDWMPDGKRKLFGFADTSVRWMTEEASAPLMVKFRSEP